MLKKIIKSVNFIKIKLKNNIIEKKSNFLQGGYPPVPPSNPPYFKSPNNVKKVTLWEYVDLNIIKKQSLDLTAIKSIFDFIEKKVGMSQFFDEKLRDFFSIMFKSIY